MAEINQNATMGNAALAAVLEGILTDLTSIKTKIAGINAKLDADGGVTDTNYASLWDVGTLETTT